MKPILDVPVWCGPAAMSAVTRRSASECVDAIRRVRGRNDVRRVRCSEIERALCLMGFAPSGTVYLAGGKMSLATWLRRHIVPDPIIVLVTNHFIAVKGRCFTDQDHVEPTSLKGSPYMRWFVQAIIELNGGAS